VPENAHFVHVSGPPARGELVEMYHLVRPPVAIPVHGALRHLRAHAALAAECQVPATVVATNGQMVRLAPGTTEIVDNVPSGRLAVDGLELLPLDGSTFRERKRILWHGAVMATVVLDDAGELLADPKVSIHGLAEEGDDGPFIDLLIDAVEDAVEDMKPAQLRDDRAVQEAVRRALRRVAGAVKGKKPTTDVHVIRVD
ncbi:MAG: MBL fold metallo-hydrolase RNA specificity domain-containing protein, partial [Alphaproteobacteria bacterium]